MILHFSVMSEMTGRRRSPGGTPGGWLPDDPDLFLAELKAGLLAGGGEDAGCEFCAGCGSYASPSQGGACSAGRSDASSYRWEF